MTSANGITWNGNFTEADEIALGAETSLRGILLSPVSLAKTIEALQRISGDTGAVEPGGDVKSTVEFCGLLDGQVFAIYDYDGGDSLLHIGGTDELDMSALLALLIKETGLALAIKAAR